MQYRELSSERIIFDSIAYENRVVNLVFADFLPSGHYGYNYPITRAAQGSGVPVSFDSATNRSNFSVGNGMVHFIDYNVQPG